MQQRFSRFGRFVGLCVLLSFLIAMTPPAHAQYNKIIGQAWIDTDCNGVYEDGDTPLLMQPVYQFAAGEDGIPSTPDDQVIGIADSYTTGSFVFSIGAPGVIYRLTILVQDQKLGLVPAPYRVGDDRTIDNDLYAPDPNDPRYWTTDGFELAAGVTTTDIDLGFCRVPLEQVYLPLVQQH